MHSVIDCCHTFLCKQNHGEPVPAGSAQNYNQCILILESKTELNLSMIFVKHLSVEMEIWKHGPLALKSTFDAIQAIDQYVGYELLGGSPIGGKSKKSII